jgi:hypothetical protein
MQARIGRSVGLPLFVAWSAAFAEQPWTFSDNTR